MIDDFEDGDADICDSVGRRGVWLIIGDGTSDAVVEPPQGALVEPTLIPGGRGASRYAAHFSGSGFTNWGVKLHTELNNQTGLAAQPYDVHTAGGISFWMRSNVSVYVNLTLPQTTGTYLGGDCVDMGQQTNCFNHFKYRPPTPPDADTWVEYQIPFAALGQSTFGPPGDQSYGSATWTPTQLLAVEFQVDPNETFDVWIDDVSFFNCITSDCVPTCDATAPQACPGSGLSSGLSPAACWPAGTDCNALPVCTDPAAPIGCPATVDVPAGCGPPWTDCSEVIYFGLWGSASGDAWAVGSRGTIRRLQGSTWSTVSGTGITQDLLSVWGSGADDVWAVGSRGTMAHWNGAGWTSLTSGTNEHLISVRGSGPTDVWAVGSGGTILHYDGSAWSPKPSGTSEALLGVWVESGSDAWAVGRQATLLHWDGNAWSAVADSATTEDLVSVWGTAADDVWVTGIAGTLLHWNGGAWNPTTTIDPTQNLLGVWGSGPSNLWVVGTTILDGDGIGWSVDPFVPVPPLDAIWGSGPDDVWAAGFGGILLHRDASGWSDHF